jgi:hypothetical protein
VGKWDITSATRTRPLAFGVFAFLGFCLLLFFCWVLIGA